MSDIKGTEIKCLDHGFVRVVDTMGDDGAVVQAARVSYAEGTKTINEDRGLIRYLMRHHHSTPFEMAEIKLHCKMPLFVARQWIRHRTANVNEMSARYSVLPEEFYIPEESAMALQSSTNNQGRGNVLEEGTAERMLIDISEHGKQSYALYADLCEHDLARELSRMVLPVNIYTEWYWKIDVHNLLHFLRLRADPHAQMEIRVFAEAILKMVAEWMPLTYEAFVDYRQNAVMLSGQEYQALLQLATQSHVEDSLWQQLSKREQVAFTAKFVEPILEE